MSVYYLLSGLLYNDHPVYKFCNSHKYIVHIFHYHKHLVWNLPHSKIYHLHSKHIEGSDLLPLYTDRLQLHNLFDLLHLLKTDPRFFYSLYQMTHSQLLQFLDLRPLLMSFLWGILKATS